MIIVNLQEFHHFKNYVLLTLILYHVVLLIQQEFFHPLSLLSEYQ